MLKITAAMATVMMLTGCASGPSPSQLRMSEYIAALNSEVKAGHMTESQAAVKEAEFRQREAGIATQAAAATYRRPISCYRYSEYNTVCN